MRIETVYERERERINEKDTDPFDVLTRHHDVSRGRVEGNFFWQIQGSRRMNELGSCLIRYIIESVGIWVTRCKGSHEIHGIFCDELEPIAYLESRRASLTWSSSSQVVQMVKEGL